MGLCKCPKRKTTSHFCFHHCVNVCEYCIINTHTICIVKSYTTWLKEASGNSISSSITSSALCAVCQKQFLSPKEFENVATNFNDTIFDSKLPIRLLCYHVMHAQCLSVYVKNQLKENKSFKCPSCTWPLWVQQQNVSSNSNDSTQPDFNELSPVALQLYKHLLNHGKWWGQAVITNSNVNNIEKHLIEDEIDYEETAREKSQLFGSQSSLEIKPQINNTISDVSLLLAPTQTVLNSKNSYNDTHQMITSNVTTMNHRNNILQTHHRHFNNNYGIDSVNTHQQQSFVNISQDSDLNNEYLLKSSSPLLLNNDNNLNYNEKQYSNKKYKPKKFSNHSWTSSYQRIIHYFCGTSAEDNTSKRTTFIIICLLISIIILLVTVTSYAHSKNIPVDNNSIDYAGENDGNNL